MISKRYFWQSLVAVVLGLAYYFTLLPGPGYSGDTEKFQFVGHILGTPHETGYPAYVLLNFVFTTVFPVGTLAFKANLLSAFCSVSALLILFGILARLGIGMFASFVATVTFGFGYTVWTQSLIAEVYALNLLFVALVIYFFMRWHHERKAEFFFVGCLAYALSFGNHLTMITFLPAIVYIVWQTEKSSFADFKRIVAVLFIIMLGASQYAYIFLRSHNPTTQYLEMSATDWHSFWNAVSGGHFSHLLFGFSLNWMLLERLPALLLFILRELLFILPFTMVGLTNFQNRKIGMFLFLGIAGNFVFCLGYAIYDIFVYLIPSYFILAVFSARGLQAMIELLKQKAPSVTPAFFLIIPLVIGFLNLISVDQHHNTTDNQKVLEILQKIENDAAIVCPDYHYAMIFWYHIFADNWKSKNIHIVFYHDQRFPSSEISQYILSQKRFFVPVTRDSLPPGLKTYLFLDSFDVTLYQPFVVRQKDKTESAVALQNLTRLRKSELEAHGLRLRELSRGLFAIE